MRRALFAAAVVLSVADAVLWGVAIAGIWACPVPVRAMPVVRAGAVAAFAGAAVCWIGLYLRDRDRRYLLDAIVIQHSALARTLPLRAAR